MADEDRKQIGLTQGGRATVTKLVDDLRWFEEAQAAARFALAYAVRAGVTAGQTAEAVETRWSPDLFDASGEIRTLLRVLYPDSKTPVRLIEHLIDVGLGQIAKRIDDGDTDPVRLFDFDGPDRPA